jgi:hypothetical protein
MGGSEGRHKLAGTHSAWNASSTPDRRRSSMGSSLCTTRSARTGSPAPGGFPTVHARDDYASAWPNVLSELATRVSA